MDKGKLQRRYCLKLKNYEIAKCTEWASFVIPANTGIRSVDVVLASDFRLRDNERDFLRIHQKNGKSYQPFCNDVGFPARQRHETDFYLSVSMRAHINFPVIDIDRILQLL